MAETGKTLIRWVLVIAGIWFLLVATPAVLNVFRLDGSDTLQDFKKASVDRQVSFLMKLCHDGVCIEKVAWRCGFSLTGKAGSDCVDCFGEVARSAKPWTKIDAARKWCGHRSMEFTGDLYGDPEECKALGGEWGVPPGVAQIQF